MDENEMNGASKAISFDEATVDGKRGIICYFNAAPLIVGAGWSPNSAARDLASELRRLAEWIEDWVNRMEADASPTGKPPADQDGAT